MAGRMTQKATNGMLCRFGIFQYELLSFDFLYRVNSFDFNFNATSDGLEPFVMGGARCTAALPLVRCRHYLFLARRKGVFDSTIHEDMAAEFSPSKINLKYSRFSHDFYSKSSIDDFPGCRG
jgi:hypothetical protein